MKNAIIVDEKDNVATALDDLEPGETVKARLGDKAVEIKMKGSVKYGHKFALSRLAKGERVIKYGETIGQMGADVDQGEHVHVHNMLGLRATGEPSA